MTAFSFVELNLLQVAGVDPSEYEGLPREFTYNLYSDILGHLPLLDAKDIPLFNELAKNPLLRQFAIDASSLYALANVADKTFASDIEDAVKTISYQNNASGYRFMNRSNEWLSQFNSIAASQEFDGDQRDLLGHYRDVIVLFGNWLVSHDKKTHSNPYSNPYYDPIKESQMNIVAILLFEDLVPSDLYYQWPLLAGEAQTLIEQFSSYNAKAHTLALQANGSATHA